MWYILSKQNSPKIVRKYRAARNFLQIYFLTLLHNANEIKANQHNEIQHSWFAVYPQKTLYFLVFHRNIGLKTSIYEFSDRIHQNKQGFEGKKLSGKEFVAFEEYHRACVAAIASSAILTIFLPGFSRLSCLLSSRIL